MRESGASVAPTSAPEASKAARSGPSGTPFFQFLLEARVEGKIAGGSYAGWLDGLNVGRFRLGLTCWRDGGVCERLPRYLVCSNANAILAICVHVVFMQLLSHRGHPAPRCPLSLASRRSFVIRPRYTLKLIPRERFRHRKCFRYTLHTAA